MLTFPIQGYPYPIFQATGISLVSRAKLAFPFTDYKEHTVAEIMATINSFDPNISANAEFVATMNTFNVDVNISTSFSELSTLNKKLS